MTNRDWFRNESWNEAIASEFESKLKRARRKDEYLYIQALTLANSCPAISLELIDRYFELNDRGRDSEAYVARASAYLAQDNLAAAIDAYEAALEREALSPGIITQANLDLPYLVATRGLTELHDRALDILKIASGRLAFPVERFKYHASRAIILEARGDLTEARSEARAALDAAAADKSGFQHHTGLGLVSKRHASGLSMLRGLCDA